MMDLIIYSFIYLFIYSYLSYLPALLVFHEYIYNILILISLVYSSCILHFIRAFFDGFPIGERADGGFADLLAVAIAQNGFQHDADGDGEF